MKHFSSVLTPPFFVLFLTNFVMGQSFFGIDGGFEGAATIDNINTYTAPQSYKWTKTDTSITLSQEIMVVRSGAHSLKISMAAKTGRRIYSPEYIITASTSKWYVQYFIRSTDTANTQEQKAGNIRDGVEAMSNNYTSAMDPGVWEKVRYAPMSVTLADTVSGLIMTRAKGSGGDVYVDDFCIYASAAVDNAAPNPPISPSASPTENNGELLVAWTEASDGIDSGGYMAVRKIGSVPTIAPNVNGIYAVGNVVTPGEEIVYIGTASSFTDSGLDLISTYYYTIYTYDKAYNYSTGIQTAGNIAIPTGVEALNISIPKIVDLAQNYPNPFNPSTTINFFLPGGGNATLNVYNMLGQKIATLWNGTVQAGYPQKVVFDGSRFSSGIYYYILVYSGQRYVKRMLLIK